MVFGVFTCYVRNEAPGLQIPPSVGVEVGVADGFHEPHQPSAGVDAVDELRVRRVQTGIRRSVDEVRQGRVQSWIERCLV